eukprot:TRINITY_DN148_c0_g2_i1.p1 TRINITY_DN148_c0_g2~~TRINITY_DN148_c0_g2_i1.p1  ORF type:complete len:685 (-),score=149.52 TRINITY_DN148_c0_g2_i1:32-2053(-)
MDVSELLLLQSKIKMDPQGYHKDFIKQYHVYTSSRDLFQLQPSVDSKEFGVLVNFIAQVAQFYSEEVSNFPSEVAELLEQHSDVMDPKLRVSLVKSLILLRNRNLLSPIGLLALFFKLFRCKDKKLRILLHNHIVNDVKKCNTGKRNNALNNKLQSFMYTMLLDDSAISPRESLKVMIELYRKNIWNDKKTVNAICSGIFSKDSKIISIVINFFLNADEDEEDLVELANQKKREVALKYSNNHAGKKKRRKKQYEKEMAKVDQMRKRANVDRYDEKRSFNYAAMNLINDPQHYAEQVFGVLKKSNHSFDLKVRIMAFLSKLIATHELLIESFYSFMQRYCQPHQQHITQLLAIFANSCHLMVSPDILEGPIRSIANNFVSDRRANEVIALGLNSIREICLRCPLAMNETLLKDLIQYKKSKDKGIMMAARSLLGVYRVINPAILPKKERGKYADINVKPLEYGQQEVIRNIPGMDQLDESSEDNSGSWEVVGDDVSDDSDVSEEFSGDQADSEREVGISGSMEELSSESGFVGPSRAEPSKLMSQEDWERLQEVQRRMIEKNPEQFGTKRRLAELYDVDLDEEIDPESLRGPLKRSKATKEERVMSAKEGVKEFKLERKKGDNLSRTNMENKKNKAYGMIKHKKVRRNNRMSYKQRQKKRAASKRKNTKSKWH